MPARNHSAVGCTTSTRTRPRPAANTDCRALTVPNAISRSSQRSMARMTVVRADEPAHRTASRSSGIRSVISIGPAHRCTVNQATVQTVTATTAAAEISPPGAERVAAGRELAFDRRLQADAGEDEQDLHGRVGRGDRTELGDAHGPGDQRGGQCGDQQLDAPEEQVERVAPEQLGDMVLGYGGRLVEGGHWAAPGAPTYSKQNRAVRAVDRLPGRGGPERVPQRRELRRGVQAVLAAVVGRRGGPHREQVGRRPIRCRCS